MATEEIGVTLNLESLPLLPGARVCLEELGISSTLHKANRRTAGLSITDPSAEILFDPQTAGGLLLSVAEDEADRLLQELREQGYEYAVAIGSTVSRTAGAASMTFGE